MSCPRLCLAADRVYEGVVGAPHVQIHLPSTHVVVQVAQHVLANLGAKGSLEGRLVASRFPKGAGTVPRHGHTDVDAAILMEPAAVGSERVCSKKHEVNAAVLM